MLLPGTYVGSYNRSAKPFVLHSCAKSPAQARTLAKRDSTCSELFHPTCRTLAKRDSMSHELFHPTCKTLSAMPLTTRSTTQNGSARAARQALLSEAAARSGPLEPKLGTQNACVRSVRQASHLPQMRRDNLQARRHALPGPRLVTQTASVRNVRQVPHLPQMRRVKL